MFYISFDRIERSVPQKVSSITQERDESIDRHPDEEKHATIESANKPSPRRVRVDACITRLLLEENNTKGATKILSSV